MHELSIHDCTRAGMDLVLQDVVLGHICDFLDAGASQPRTRCVHRAIRVECQRPLHPVVVNEALGCLALVRILVLCEIWDKASLCILVLEEQRTVELGLDERTKDCLLGMGVAEEPGPDAIPV